MMEEKDKETQVSQAPDQPEMQDAEVEQDAEETVVDTPPTSEVDVEKEESGNESAEATLSKEENDRRAEREKLKKLERENNELLKVKQLVDALDSAAAEDPEFMKLANKKLVEKGLLPETILAELEQRGTQSGETPQTDVPYQSNITDPALQWAQQKMREEQDKRVEFFNKFEAERPDINDGDPDTVKANRQAVTAAAVRLIRSGKSMEEAYDYAYKQIMHPEQLIEEGKLEGMAQAQSAAPTETAASGGAANSSGRVELTPEQKEAARLFGLTEEDYAKSLED